MTDRLTELLDRFDTCTRILERATFEGERYPVARRREVEAERVRVFREAVAEASKETK